MKILKTIISPVTENEIVNMNEKMLQYEEFYLFYRRQKYY